jgi:hypothetical protein
LSNKTSNTLPTIGAFAVVIAAIAAIYALCSQVLSAFAGLDAKFGAALVAAAGTVIVSVVSVVVSRYLEARAAIRKEHREKKIPVYEDLIRFMFKVMMGVKTGDAPNENEIIEFMTDFSQRSMVWASDDVLNAWIRFRGASVDVASQATNNFSVMFVYEDLLRAIRKDLGHQNKGLTNGKLLSLFVTDIAKYVDAQGNIQLPSEMTSEQSGELEPPKTPILKS